MFKRFLYVLRSLSIFSLLPSFLFFLFSLLILTACTGPADGQGGNAEKEMERGNHPNVVIFLSDDQGWGDLSFNGNTELNTPHVDSLAEQGAHFNNFFVCAVCAPTRAEFLTGRYHPRSGVRGVTQGAERMNLDETTIADLFKKAGYRTGIYGKWHNGMQFPYHPNGRGFDEFYGFASGHWGHYFDPMLEHNGKVVKGKGFIIDDFTDKAIAFMEASHAEGAPFFVYLPYNTPHSPMQVPDEYWERFAGRDFKQLNPKQKGTSDHDRAAYAMCENIDWNVGRVLKTLDELNLSEDTIVVYFNDNGPNGFRWLDGYKGKKGTVDEGGVKSPLHIRYPKKVTPGTRVESLSGAIDLLPTLAELAGLTIQTAKPLDGRSMVADLTQEDSGSTERILMNAWGKRVSARSQRFRMDEKGQLYDMVKDRGQTSPVNQEFPEIADQLEQAVEDFRTQVMGEKKTIRPFLVGHPGAKYHHLPARDAVATGQIQRSSWHANCTFFTNWTSTGEKITWNGEVPAEGHFKVTVYYTCPESDLGSEVVFRAGKRELSFTISEAHDPPLVGEAQDRAPRTESYVKDFKALEIGTIFLGQGPMPFELQPLAIAGEQVMDFRLLVLERI
ncbi:MAG: arylsulfatase [Verrucomicrobiota bacterium]